MPYYPNEFLAAAKDALSFLEDKGFQLAKTTVPAEDTPAARFYQVIYRSPKLFVQLSTAPARLELDLQIGRTYPPNLPPKMTVHELLMIESPNTTIQFNTGIYKGFGNIEEMKQQYNALARVLREHGHRFFADDSSLWADLRDLRHAEAAPDDDLSRRADIAFKQKNWPEAITLLKQVGERRTELQTARLKYALERLEPGS